MEQKLAQLKRVRTIRADQREKDYLRAKAAFEEATRIFRKIGREREDVLAEITRRETTVVTTGELTGSTIIEKRNHAVEQLKGYVKVLEQKLRVAFQNRKKRQAEMEEALAIWRKADRSKDQISELHQRVSEEGAQKAEILEEMNEEPRPRPPMT
jgi:flagellar biosynthesis chaperone FliJ